MKGATLALPGNAIQELRTESQTIRILNYEQGVSDASTHVEGATVDLWLRIAHWHEVPSHLMRTEYNITSLLPTSLGGPYP